MKRSYDAGLTGEAAAEAFLQQIGMTLLEKRYRAQDGEIDLIMLDGEILVFVEVKYRPHGDSGAGLSAVTRSKQRRMTHAAMDYLQKREYFEHPVRFDVVEISRDGITHVPNAFPAIE